MPAESAICWVLVHEPAADRSRDAAGAGRRTARASPRGAASPTSPCSRCGWASSPGTAAWRVGGTMRVSQVQAVQPFLTMFFAVPILGETARCADARVRGGGRRGRRRRAQDVGAASAAAARRRRRFEPPPPRARRSHRPGGHRHDPPSSTGPWHLAARTARMNPSAIREILKLTELPGIISLAGGLPSADTVPGRGDARGDRARAARHAARGAAVRGERRLRAAARMGRRATWRARASRRAPARSSSRPARSRGSTSSARC